MSDTYRETREISPTTPQVFHKIDEGVSRRVLAHAWPRPGVEVITGAEDLRTFYARAADHALSIVHDCAARASTVGWIKFAYAELELWNMVFQQDRGALREVVRGPATLTGPARYGWQYVIEHVLGAPAQARTGHPTDDDLAACYTALLVASSCSQYEALVDGFPERFGGARVRFHERFTVVPPGPPELGDWVVAVGNHLQKGAPSAGEVKLDPGNWNEEQARDVDLVLMDLGGFVLADAERTLAALGDLCSKELGVSIAVCDWRGLVKRLATTPESRTSVERVLDFFLFRRNNLPADGRNFRDRSQIGRMVNYGGVVMDDVDDLAVLYGRHTLPMAYRRASVPHVLVSPFLFATAVDTLLTKIPLGKRPDLKVNRGVRTRLGLVESAFRRGMFEHEVVRCITDEGHPCLPSLTHVPWGPAGRSLPCGEIDAVAFVAATRTLLVVEAKAYSALTSMADLRRNRFQHFRPGGFEEKLLHKAAWVRDHATEVVAALGVNVDARSVQVVPVFVTRYPSVAGVVGVTYPVLLLDEFPAWLRGEAPASGVESPDPTLLFDARGVLDDIGPVVLTISREEIEASDHDRLSTLIGVVGPREVLAGNTSFQILLFVDGYNDDPRELWEIPEVLDWYLVLYRLYPQLAFFLDPGSCRLFFYMVLRMLSDSTENPTSDLSVEVLKRTFVAFNEVMAAWAGPSAGRYDAQFAARTKIVTEALLMLAPG